MLHGEEVAAVLGYIREHPNSRSAVIAADLGLDTKAVAGHINRLARDGKIVWSRPLESSQYRVWRLASWGR